MTQTAYPKRLIEVDLPIKRISAHARREKSIRHGHISTLHIWWARRPLAACRAVICAALWFDPADENCPADFREEARQAMRDWADVNLKLMTNDAESFNRFSEYKKNPAKLNSNEELREALLDFTACFANWDSSTVPEFLEMSRRLTESAHFAAGGEKGTRPLVADPFAGGGAIPLEALRVGADAFASDLNPVAVLLNKVMLEYIPRYGQQLADEVRKWGAWVKEQAEKELAEFYPKDPDGAMPVAYLWARTVLSESPSGQKAPIEVPLFRTTWLTKKRSQGNNWAFRWSRDQNGRVITEPLEVTYADGVKRKVLRPLLEMFQPKSSVKIDVGTSKGGAATCPVTGFTTSVENVRSQLKQRAGGTADARLLCVVKTSPNSSGKSYQLPSPIDIRAVNNARLEIERRQKRHSRPESLIPSGKLNHLRGFFNVVLYGMTTWGELFSPRQALALTTLVQKIQEAEKELQKEYDAGLAAAVQTCLALALDRQADYCSSLCSWVPSGEFIGHTFGRQALPMVWDFIEPNIFADSGWAGACEWVRRVIEATAEAQMDPGSTTCASATAHPLSDDAVDAVITDPPYYAAIPYADLSDFFYSWLKRTLSNVHGGLLQSDLAPKDDECVSLSHRAAMYRHKDASWFESTMTQACAESRRIAKPTGIGVFVFANKETSGWEAMLAALISSGWVITASWAIDTEMGTRLRAQNSAALASSVHLVCRPRENADGSSRDNDIGDWRDVLRELPIRIHEWMPRLAKEGVVGADAIFACLGPALEIFSRYSRVEKASGEHVTLREYLEYVWAAVAKEALTLIFAGATDADVTGFEADARLTAIWLWTLFAGAKSNGDKQGADDEAEDEGDDEESAGKSAKSSGFTLEYDAARKIAQGLGAHLEELTQLVEIKGDKARLLPVAERTKHLFGKDESESPRRGAKKKDKQAKLFDNLDDVEAEAGGWGDKSAPKLGDTVLDRVHQAMILFAAGRGDAMKRFLVDDGVGNDERFWRLANALSALYPSGGDEKRWVDGVLARKKGLGL
jgi:putative DNA methylase